jgi:hypothetical protein
MAAVVALLAALFSGLQWREARDLRALVTQPVLSWYVGNDASATHIGLEIDNNGPGVAIIRSIDYFVDHHATPDLADAMTAAGLESDRDRGEDIDDGDSLAVGQRVWVLEYRTTSKAERARFVQFLDDHLSASVTYCSLSGKCWTKCTEKKADC